MQCCAFLGDGYGINASEPAVFQTKKLKEKLLGNNQREASWQMTDLFFSVNQDLGRFSQFFFFFLVEA